jgi:NAD(P)-dependent dehydrogenase (short-subunit alcohol dehydrogenase family)
VSGRLDGRTALVVGASRGIGAEIARAFAREGAAVGVTARSADALDALRDELLATGARCAAVAADAAEPAAADDAVAVITAQLGPVDVLVYAAGQSAVGRFEDLDDGVWDRLYAVNVVGAVRFARAVLPGMRERRWGRVINIASTAAKYGSTFQSPYNATKHAMLGLTRCLALETAGDGVTVNAICPGFVDTEMVHDAVPEWGRLLGIAPDEVIGTVLARVPTRRLIQTSEVAELACYLASAQAGALTGQGVTLAGGLILI